MCGVICAQDADARPSHSCLRCVALHTSSVTVHALWRSWLAYCAKTTAAAAYQRGNSGGAASAQPLHSAPTRPLGHTRRSARYSPHDLGPRFVVIV